MTSLVAIGITLEFLAVEADMASELEPLEISVGLLWAVRVLVFVEVLGLVNTKTAFAERISFEKP